MRVLLVSAYFRPHVGGVERFTENLARGLAERGHDVTVVCCRTERGSPAREDIDSIRVRRVPAVNPFERRLGVPYPLPEPFGLARALRASADVVHVQDVLYATSIATLLRAPAPIVLTQHVGVVPQRHAALDAAQRAAYRATAPLARRAAARTSYNTAVAQFAEQLWGVPVRVLPVASVAGGAQVTREELGLPRDRFLALFVGRDVAKKRLDVVLAAADPRYEIVAVTDADVAAPPGVRVLPAMDADRLGALMRAVDAFVLPSIGEGIPLALQEAMSVGLPIVASYNPGYDAYFARDDVIAVQPNAEDVRRALVSLAEDDELRRRLSARSLAVAAEFFDAETFVDAYEQLYAEIARPWGA